MLLSRNGLFAATAAARERTKENLNQRKLISQTGACNLNYLVANNWRLREAELHTKHNRTQHEHWIVSMGRRHYQLITTTTTRFSKRRLHQFRSKTIERQTNKEWCQIDCANHTVYMQPLLVMRTLWRWQQQSIDVLQPIEANLSGERPRSLAAIG